MATRNGQGKTSCCAQGDLVGKLGDELAHPGGEAAGSGLKHVACGIQRGSQQPSVGKLGTTDNGKKEWARALFQQNSFSGVYVSLVSHIFIYILYSVVFLS